MPQRQRLFQRDLSDDFGKEIMTIIDRIEGNSLVTGIMFVKKSIVHFCTVPDTMAQTMITRLPSLNNAMHRALTEIDITDELIAYRIETKTNEILVAAGKEYTACVMHTIKKNKQKSKK